MNLYISNDIDHILYKVNIGYLTGHETISHILKKYHAKRLRDEYICLTYMFYQKTARIRK